jgi:hypothetical protein
MSDVNTIVLSGKLVTDPKWEGPNNYSSCNFYIVVKDEDEKVVQPVNDTVFMPNTFMIEVRGKFAETCMKYLKQDREVIVSGKVMRNYWKGFMILAKQVQFLGVPPTQEELAKPPRPIKVTPWYRKGASEEEAIEPFVRKEMVLREYPPIGRYRIRIIERSDMKLLDVREYHSTPEFEGFTSKGIRLSELDEIRLLRDSLTDVVDKKFSPL